MCSEAKKRECPICHYTDVGCGKSIASRDLWKAVPRAILILGICIEEHDRYAYANNNPVLYNDPDGHSSCVGSHADDGPDCAEKEWSDTHKQREIKEYQDRVERGILNSIDSFDLGDGTIQLGFAINGFSGPGIRGDIAIAMDFKGNFAFLATGGGGAYTAVGGGAGLYFATTNAPNVSYLEGNDVQVGGQVGELGTVNTEVVSFLGPDRNQYGGLSISGGAGLNGPWPGEIHTTATHTYLLGPVDVPHLIVQGIVAAFGSPGLEP